MARIKIIAYSLVLILLPIKAYCQSYTNEVFRAVVSTTSHSNPPITYSSKILQLDLLDLYGFGPWKTVGNTVELSTPTNTLMIQSQTYLSSTSVNGTLTVLSPSSSTINGNSDITGELLVGTFTDPGYAMLVSSGAEIVQSTVAYSAASRNNIFQVKSSTNMIYFNVRADDSSFFNSYLAVNNAAGFAVYNGFVNVGSGFNVAPGSDAQIYGMPMIFGSNVSTLPQLDINAQSVTGCQGDNTDLNADGSACFGNEGLQIATSGTMVETYGISTATMTVTNLMTLPAYTSVQLGVAGTGPIPLTGSIVNNSTIKDVCISTGTSRGNWALAGSKGTVGCY